MILLFSGGLDSYIAYHYLNKPQTLYFNLNTRYSAKELVVVKKLIPSTIIENCIDFQSREEKYSAFVPYRNLHLALLANKYSDTIVIAGVKDDNVNDKNQTIFEEFSRLMTKMMDKEIKVISPFWNATKVDIIKWFIQHGGTKEKLLSTISCYSEEDTLYCGACPACFRKWCALRAIGIDTLEFTNESLMRKYFDDALIGSKYDTDRNLNIIKQIRSVRPGWR